MLLSKEEVNVLRLTSADAFELVAKAESEILAKLAGAELPEPINQSLAEDIDAIDTRYRGDPSYEHDAYWMRRAAAEKVRMHFEKGARDAGEYLQKEISRITVERDALAAKLMPLAKNGKDAYQKLQQAAAQIVSAQSEPSRWGCVGPDAQDIAWDKFNELANFVCLAMDSPPIDAAKGGQQ
jgi:chromosome segregation ATPase